MCKYLTQQAYSDHLLNILTVITFSINGTGNLQNTSFTKYVSGWDVYGTLRNKESNLFKNSLITICFRDLGLNQTGQQTWSYRLIQENPSQTHTLGYTGFGHTRLFGTSRVSTGFPHYSILKNLLRTNHLNRQLTVIINSLICSKERDNKNNSDLALSS